MKKVIFLCDGKNYSKAAFEFVKSLNETERILLKGVFFLSVDYRILISSAIYPDPEPLAELTADETDNVKNSINYFKESCIKNNIHYGVDDKSKAWNEIDLVKETRFSDLLVMSEEMFFKNWGNEQPNHFTKQVMHNAECPVMVIPENYTPFKKILIAYDGRPDTLFAIKQFSQLFPDLTNIETSIIYLKEEENTNIPDLEYLKEYLSCHFSNAKIEKLHFDPSKYLTDWIGYIKNTLLVTGSFGRSALSGIFRKSFAEKLIKEHSVPVFIAHSSK